MHCQCAAVRRANTDLLASQSDMTVDQVTQQHGACRGANEYATALQPTACDLAVHVQYKDCAALQILEQSRAPAAEMEMNWRYGSTSIKCCSPGAVALAEHNKL